MFGQCNCCVIFTSLTTVHSMHWFTPTSSPFCSHTTSLPSLCANNGFCIKPMCVHVHMHGCVHASIHVLLSLCFSLVTVCMLKCMPVSPHPHPPPTSTPAPLWIIIHSNFTVYPSHMAKPSSPFLVLSYNLPCVAPFQTELCIVCMFLHPSIPGLSQTWTWHQLPSAQGIDNLQEEHKWLTGSYVRAAQNQTHSSET